MFYFVNTKKSMTFPSGWWCHTLLQLWFTAVSTISAPQAAASPGGRGCAMGRGASEGSAGAESVPGSVPSTVLWRVLWCSSPRLAQVLRARGALAEAEALRRRLLQLDEKIFGPNHRNTFVALNHLAGVLQIRGQLTEAQL